MRNGRDAFETAQTAWSDIATATATVALSDVVVSLFLHSLSTKGFARFNEVNVMAMAMAMATATYNASVTYP